MKRIYLLLFPLLTIAAFSCDKGETVICETVTTRADTAETADLLTYLIATGKAATPDSRGFFYTIIDSGNATRPTPCQRIKVNYSGKLTTGQEFDANNGVAFSLKSLIVGWREGIPLIGEGGKIILYLPPSLAYGAAAQSGIPANSILIFTIDLVEVFP